MATRRSAVFTVVAVAHSAGLALMVALAFLFREPVPALVPRLWALIAGFVGAIGLACLYRSLSIGKMGLNAPLSSIIAVLIPLTFSLLHEGPPPLSRMAGLAVAVVSIWLIATQTGASIRPEGFGLAVASGFGLGGFALLIKFAATAEVFWPIALARVGSLALMLTLVALNRNKREPLAGSLRWMLLAGVLDTSANALYVAAAQRGSLAVAAALSSLYPASTVILARVVLKERWSRLQGVGMLSALVAVGLISY
jgi:drug/metabolite transporter (DMT)-like permease